MSAKARSTARKSKGGIMAIDNAEMTVRTREAIDNGANRYFFIDEKEQVFEKQYKYVDENRKLLSFANGIYGTISDCYILFAVASLGVTDRRGIQNFLTVLKSHDQNRYIADPSDDANYSSRIAQLSKYGLLFKFKYYYGINDGIGKENTLYTVAGDAVNLVNQKLSRKCVENKWIQAKSPRELLGWASAAFVGIKLSNQRNFKQFEDGVFRNRGVGSYHFPCECKYVIEGKEGLFPAYVAVIDSYLFYDERIHNESEYDEYVEKKLNAIRKYIRYRSNKGPCFIVCSCMNDSDLNELGSMMIRADFSQEELEHIYFTGAGAFDESRIVDCPYLRMKINESEDAIEYDFYAERPLFLI